MGVARIFQRGGHTDSYRGYSSDCHLNIVSCLLRRRLTKGGSRAPQETPPPLATPMLYFWKTGENKIFHFIFIFVSLSLLMISNY